MSILPRIVHSWGVLDLSPACLPQITPQNKRKSHKITPILPKSAILGWILVYLEEFLAFSRRPTGDVMVIFAVCSFHVGGRSDCRQKYPIFWEWHTSNNMESRTWIVYLYPRRRRRWSHAIVSVFRGIISKARSVGNGWHYVRYTHEKLLSWHMRKGYFLLAAMLFRFRTRMLNMAKMSILLNELAEVIYGRV